MNGTPNQGRRPTYVTEAVERIDAAVGLLRHALAGDIEADRAATAAVALLERAVRWLAPRP
jgi:hypothetical protein